MSLSKVAGAAVLLVLTRVAMAGSAHVVNNCGFPVYYAYVGQSQHDEMQELQGSFTAAYGAQGNGISIKLAPSKDAQVTQFELTPDGDSIFYDISNIDGNSFKEWGMSLVPSVGSDTAHPTCIPVDCPAGVDTCSEAYNAPDDVRTNVCAASTDLTFTLCTGGSSGSPTTGSDSPSSSSDGSTPASSSSAPAASESAATPVASEPATETTGGHGWGKPPAKRAEHAHKRVHSRAFRV